MCHSRVLHCFTMVVVASEAAAACGAADPLPVVVAAPERAGVPRVVRDQHFHTDSVLVLLSYGSSKVSGSLEIK